MNNLDFLKKYKLFIVDYDGTILDSMRMWETTLSSFLKSENISFDVDIDELSKEQTNSESVEYMNKNYFPDLTFDELANKMYQFVKRQYVKQKLKNNATILLNELRKYGKVVLFSATSNELLNDSFNSTGVNDYFDYVYSASEMKTTKTNGIGFLKVIEKENINKEDVLVIEDVYHAISGAKEQHIDTLAIFDNQNHWNDIKKLSNYNLNLDELN